MTDHLTFIKHVFFCLPGSTVSWCPFCITDYSSSGSCADSTPLPQPIEAEASWDLSYSLCFLTYLVSMQGAEITSTPGSPWESCDATPDSKYSSITGPETCFLGKHVLHRAKILQPPYRLWIHILSGELDISIWCPIGTWVVTEAKQNSWVYSCKNNFCRLLEFQLAESLLYICLRTVGLNFLGNPFWKGKIRSLITYSSSSKGGYYDLVFFLMYLLICSFPNSA